MRIVMTLPTGLISSISSAWDVLILFLIPIGGGIPAGVLLAKNREIAWPLTVALYFISDVILACVFDPLMWLLISAAKRSPLLSKMGEVFKASMKKTTSQYGTHLGPIALIMISFGADPMTGRAATAAVGHGFVSGWALAIAGDMLYFMVLMASTLWLNGVLGDETRTTLIILVAMMVVPAIVRRVKEARAKKAKTDPLHWGS